MSIQIPLSILGYQSPASPPTICLGDALALQLSESTTIHNFLDCLPSTPEPAIFSSNSSRPPLTHAELCSFLSTFTLPCDHPLSHTDRVAILLPNGPENAVALLCIAAYYTCAPMNASSTAAEIREDIVRLGVKAILTTRELERHLGLRSIALELDCSVVYADARRSGFVGLFDLELSSEEVRSRAGPSVASSSSRLNELDDRCLVLCTSGTSGRKKVVPYTLKCLIVGSWAVVQSWDLKPSDVNLNMMPLFHVGGVVRNLLAPVFSGGSTIVCPGFDAVAFWSIASKFRATWYYSAPTIHNAILSSQPSDIIPSRDLSIRMICNAAGGLLPSLAVELKDRFSGAVVLPSYGMTECMPIASPPTTYQLDRPGCSGIPCGPHISIRDPRNLERELRTGEHGAVSVRGFPTFSGYELSPNPEVPLDTSIFTSEGWFDTGDVGYLDDGYLFITGRSKEIINKGGEVISPFEIEEAVSIAAKGIVKATLAFSVEHDVLQEIIGLVVVPASDQVRLGLQQLHSLIKDSLHPSKWPFVLVYMNDIPKNSAGKPQRINLAKRLGLGRFSDTVPMIGRHFEAQTLMAPTQISDSIPCIPVSIDCSAIHTLICKIAGVAEAAVCFGSDGTPEAFVAVEAGSTIEHTSSIITSLSPSLPGYALPQIHLFDCAFPRNSDGSIDFESLEKYELSQSSSRMSSNSLLVRDIIADLLTIDPTKITLQSDFFLLGGSSLLLGKLSYQLRKHTGVGVGIASLFTNSTIGGIASLIGDERFSYSRSSTLRASTIPDFNFKDISPHRSSGTLGEFVTTSIKTKTRGQDHPFVLLVQALPFIFVYPLKAALTWTIFLFMLAGFAPYIERSFWVRMGGLLFSMLSSRVVTRIMAPIVAIVFKWIVIGRYKPGVYPMWSNYYLRWWIVNQALMTAGRGVFGFSAQLEIIYYRLLGAKIGWGVRIDKRAELGEFDLITLQDGCKIDHALVRGFSVEVDGLFRLAPIVIGPNVSINTMTQITPGSTIPENSVYGPQSSTDEGPSPPEYSIYNRMGMAQPHWALQYFVGWPIVGIVYFISLLPWLTVLWIMFDQTFRFNDSDTEALTSVIFWFANPTRVAFHLVAKAVRAVIVPVLHLVLGIIVKRILGLNTECCGSTPSQMFLFRQFVNSKLLTQKQLRDAFTILGSHYEVVSMVYRAMGAKVGRRVYWPGTGINCLDPELLEIGDDVVFGSRSEILTSDGVGSEKIVVGNGAMLADRVVLLPGTSVGSGTVIGSGTLGTRNGHYCDGSMWIGSKNGKPVCLKKGAATSEMNDTTTPFGRAFYERKAPYYVYPYPLILFINILVASTGAIYWSAPAITAAQVLSLLFTYTPWLPIFTPTWYRLGIVSAIVAGIYILTLHLQALLAFTCVILMKWLLMGRRRAGQYDWDKDPYCQRWKLHLVLSSFVNQGFDKGGLLRPISGTAFIVWYYRAMGASIGKNCSMFASGRLGLMTEPDLVEIGNDVSLDNCSVVAHINSRGHFSLNHLKIGHGCAMRSGSRLLSGASMEDRSILCEHTLLTSGEVAVGGTAYTGWPGHASQEAVRLSAYS